MKPSEIEKKALEILLSMPVLTYCKLITPFKISLGALNTLLVSRKRLEGSYWTQFVKTGYFLYRENAMYPAGELQAVLLRYSEEQEAKQAKEKKHKVKHKQAA